ncbi:MAG TPA: hypothetical protein VMV06_03000 [Acidimicrobiales bacterium]|nr:hypothetical protein [Acidimicrobiales bacterium]
MPSLLGPPWEAEVSEGTKLNAHHRATVEKIFQHPVSHNIQWHDVLSLLQSVAEVTEGHDRRYRVTLGAETETLDAPPRHDVDEQMVIDLRRMLKGAGITAE